MRWRFGHEPAAGFSDPSFMMDPLAVATEADAEVLFFAAALGAAAFALDFALALLFFAVVFFSAMILSL
jgi:hypothetical protein